MRFPVLDQNLKVIDILNISSQFEIGEKLIEYIQKGVFFEYFLPDYEDEYPVVISFLSNYLSPNYSYAESHYLLNYKNAYIQIASYFDSPERFEFGKPIIFEESTLKKEQEEFVKYILTSPLSMVEYLPERGIPTFAHQWLKYHGFDVSSHIENLKEVQR